VTLAEAPARTGFHRLRVAGVERLCTDAVAVTFDVPEHLRERYGFRPGQYLTLRRVVEGGLFSGWLVDGVRPGDEVEVAPPAGSFTPDLQPGTHHGLVAAGSGITPVLSIAASVLAAHPDTRVTLIYGNRRTDTVMFTEEIADLKNAYGPRLHLVHVLSREPMAAEIATGRLDGAKLRTLLGSLVDVGDVDHWWLCGPLGVTTAAQEVLAELGVSRQRVHRELFYVDEPPPEPVRAEDEVAGETSEVTVVLDGRATTLTLPRSESVLDAAQRVRGDLPFACKGGVCGTCRAKLTEGEVSMRRNFALEDEELAAGFVLTCQSRPASEKLTLDFDS
jgi:ring-1,2-phenylacetyl-CoA epoxidase subunit PaaE